MPYINSRYRQIYKSFIDSNVPLTGDLLASITGVSARTVRNDINILNQILGKNGATILSKPGVGYYIEITNSKKHDQFKNKYFQNEVNDYLAVPTDPKGRINYIVRKLLLIDCYLKIDDLAEELFTSRSTISADLRDVREIFKQFKLEIDDRPNYGMIVVGSEIDKRICILEKIIHSRENRALFIEDISIFNNPRTLAEISLFHDIMQSVINQFDIQLSDVSFQDVLMYIIVSLKRVRFYNYVELDEKQLARVKNTVEYKASVQIIDEINNYAGEILPESEIGYLAILLKSKKIISDIDSVDILRDDGITSVIVEKILLEIEKRFGLDYSGDGKLRNALELHISPLITREQMGISSRNLMLDEIKKNLVLPLNLAATVADVIKDKLGFHIDEDEIGYIALLLGVAMERKHHQLLKQRILIVCPTSVSGAKLFQQTLKQKAGDLIAHTDFCELYKLSNIDLASYDFIVSTAPIPIDVPIPIIQLNNFLQQDDINTFRQTIINKFKFKEKLTTLFSQERFYFVENGLSFENTIHFLLDKSHFGHSGKEEVLMGIKRRNQFLSFECGNGFAIIQMDYPRNKENSISVLIFNKPVIWEAKFVQVMLFLNLNRENYQDMYPINQFIAKLVSDYKTTQDIIRCTSYEPFIHLVEDLI